LAGSQGIEAGKIPASGIIDRAGFAGINQNLGILPVQGIADERFEPTAVFFGRYYSG